MAPGLDGAQRAAGGLAEVRGQEHEAAQHESEQDRAATSHLSVVHIGKLQS